MFVKGDYMVKEEKLRSEIDDKYKWDLTKMYKDAKEFNDDYDKALELINEISRFRGKLLNDSNTLYEYLKKDDELNVVMTNLYVYASALNDEDVSNKDNQKTYLKVLNLYSLTDEKLSFTTSELLKTDYEVIKEYIKENDNLKEYAFDLEEIYRFQPYVLSEPEEKLVSNLSDLSQKFKNNFSIINNTLVDFGYIKDEDGNEVKLTNGNYPKYIKSDNRKVRKAAFEAGGKAYMKFCNLISTDYEAYIKECAMIAKCR